MKEPQEDDSYALARATQAKAADPAYSVFVTANAGSGKTKVLIDRVARLLLAGGRPDCFLCITFTKAAAAEMQRRLFDRLGGWCVADDAALTRELSDLLPSAAPFAPAQLARARALFAQALETPGGLKIQTIHAFCERLLARFPLEAGVPPGFAIAEDSHAAALLQAAWAQAPYTDDARAALVLLASRAGADSLNALAGALTAKRTRLRRFLETDPKREALLQRHGAEAGVETLIAAFISATPLRSLLEGAALLESRGVQDSQLAGRIRAALAASDPKRVAAYESVFFTGEGKPRKKLLTKQSAGDAPWLDRLLADEQARTLQFREALRAAERAADAQAAAALGAHLIDAYEAAKGAAGALDFDDLIAHARALLERSDSAPWVLYKLDGAIDHILIDEGQDTSPDQWALLKPLQQEFFAGAGARGGDRTVFAVGDPKQSIFSFQGADPKRFREEARLLETRARAAERPFTAPDLLMSFRSAPEILRAVDAVFARQDVVAGAPGVFDEIRHVARRSGQVGLVEWWPVAERPVAADPDPWDAPLDNEPSQSAGAVLARGIAETVGGWIEAGEAVWEGDKARPMRPGDVMALVRSRGPVFRELLKAFKRAGLPVAGADRIVLAEELAVEDLLALARFALDPTDDLTLATVLKGPFIGLDEDRELFPLAHGRATGERLWRRLRESEMAPARAAYGFLRALIGKGWETPYAFFASVLEQNGPSARPGWTALLARLGAAARDPVEELLARALAAGRRRAASLQAFVHDIENDSAQLKREMDRGQDSIRVMTVHGAKGLEARVVILADTTSRLLPQKAGEMLFADGDEDGGPIWSPSPKLDDSVTAAARQAAEAAARSEYLRLLYVAMTRAQDRLIVAGAAHGGHKNGRPDQSWHEIVEEGLRPIAAPCDTPFGEGLRLGAGAQANAAASRPSAARTAPEWTGRPAPAEASPHARAAPSRLKTATPPSISARASGRARFRRGRLAHGLLQRLPDLPREARDEAAERWLAAQGCVGEEAAALLVEISRVLDNPDFAPVFGPHSRAEAPLIGRIGERSIQGIIDRLVVLPDSVLIVDFKTDRPAPPSIAEAAPAYLAQIGAYRAVLKDIFPDRPIRAALLWTEEPALMQAPADLLDAAVREAFG